MNLPGPMESVIWLNIMTNQTTALCVYSVLNGRLNFDWLFENMNPDMSDPIQNVVRCWCITKEKEKKNSYHKHLILIILCMKYTSIFFGRIGELEGDQDIFKFTKCMD